MNRAPANVECPLQTPTCGTCEHPWCLGVVSVVGGQPQPESLPDPVLCMTGVVIAVLQCGPWALAVWVPLRSDTLTNGSQGLDRRLRGLDPLPSLPWHWPAYPGSGQRNGRGCSVRCKQRCPEGLKDALQCPTGTVVLVPLAPAQRLCGAQTWEMVPGGQRRAH